MAVPIDLEIPAEAASAAADAHVKDPRSLAEWVDRLSDKGMPVFAKTVKDIGGVAADRESSAAELSRVILQDAAMTARLLRVANSPIYSLPGRSISTVSRAVVLLGFDTVRSLCLSIAIIESLGNSARKARVAEHMARSFHAAVQARAFAEKRRDASPEEVFIATLLCNIGDLAFWGLQSDLAAKLETALDRPGCERTLVEREVLGFELNDLSLGLSRKWNLGKLLENTLQHKVASDPRVSNVQLAHELARSAEQGWDRPETKQLLTRIAEAVYLPLQEVTKLVHQNASLAARTAQCYGVADAAERIPLPASQRAPGSIRESIRETLTETGAKDQRAAEPVREPPKSTCNQPDPMLQLTILRELSGMLDGKHDINLLLEMVLEGISRGIGMDHTLFAMLNPERNRLRARYALGWDSLDMREKFVFDISPLHASIFSHALDTREPLWVGRDHEPQLKSLLTPAVQALTGGKAFFVMPIEVNGRSIGLFYADRSSSGRSLDEEAFTAFRHFCQQANLALAYTRRGR
ncbi:MAG TPA: HDOD domain-containing protein [Gammaproteobacteria bacterium]